MIKQRASVSVNKACDLVGVSRRTIYSWIAGQKVETVRVASGNIRIYEDSLWQNSADDFHFTQWLIQELGRRGYQLECTGEKLVIVGWQT